MADDTQNATTQLSSGTSQLISGLVGEFSAAIGSWRGLIGLTILLAFTLVWSGKWPVKSEAPSDNAAVLSAVANLKTDIAGLKARVDMSAGELGKQVEDLQTFLAKKPEPVVAPVRRVKPKAVPVEAAP